MNKKPATVAVVPTERSNMAQLIDLEGNTIKWFLQPNRNAFIPETSNGFKIVPFDLSILIEDDIKEGEWYIDDTYEVRKAVTSDSDYWEVRKSYKKIVATTDASLEVTNQKDSILLNNLPQPSQAFIKEFFKSEGTITDVMLEYNDGTCQCDTASKEQGCPYSDGMSCHKPSMVDDFYGHNPKVYTDNTINVIV